MTAMIKTTLPTDTINAEARMDATVAAVAAECSPDHAARLRAAWADMSDVIRTSAVLHESTTALTNAAKTRAVEEQARADHAIAWQIGQAAANDGAALVSLDGEEVGLTVNAIRLAIEADRAAGNLPPTPAEVEEFFGSMADTDTRAMNAAHPAVAALLDAHMS